MEILPASETKILDNKINVEPAIISGQYDVIYNLVKQSFSQSYNNNYYDCSNITWGSLNFTLRLEKHISESTNNLIFFKIFDCPSSLDVEQESISDIFNVNLNKLETSFENEYSKKMNFINISKIKVSNVFNTISKYLAELNFEHSAIEITNSNSLKFTLLFSEKKLLMITKSLNPSDINLENDDIIFSLFIDRKLIVSDVSKITAFTKGFKKYLTM